MVKLWYVLWHKKLLKTHTHTHNVIPTCHIPAGWSEPWTPHPAAVPHPSASCTSSGVCTLSAKHHSDDRHKPGAISLYTIYAYKTYLYCYVICMNTSLYLGLYSSLYPACTDYSPHHCHSPSGPRGQTLYGIFYSSLFI